MRLHQGFIQLKGYRLEVISNTPGMPMQGIGGDYLAPGHKLDIKQAAICLAMDIPIMVMPLADIHWHMVKHISKLDPSGRYRVPARGEIDESILVPIG